jgi:hypothetical protein
MIEVLKRDPFTRKLLGFIRFKYDKDGLGHVEATNFGASLEYRHLKIGATTKLNDGKQSGKHGEGFKVAALVFRRFPNNHTFRVESSGVSCNFIFNRELELTCSITPIRQSKLAAAKKKLDAAKKKTGHQGDNMVADPSKDVSVYIGETREGTSSIGIKTSGSKIHVDVFKKWLQVTLDIDAPPNKVTTDIGTLILDPAYKNKFYLQGLLLPSGSMSGREHQYGYNFFEGSTTRDRDSLSSPGQEEEQIGKIWTAAILRGGQKRSALLASYTELLLGSLNVLGDVTLVNYKRWLSRDIVERVWEYMRTINQSADGRPAFYYTTTDGEDVSVRFRSV